MLSSAQIAGSHLPAVFDISSVGSFREQTHMSVEPPHAMPFAPSLDAKVSVCSSLLLKHEHSRSPFSRCVLGERMRVQTPECLPPSVEINLTAEGKDTFLFSFFFIFLTVSIRKKQLLHVNVFDICQGISGKARGSDQLKPTSLISEPQKKIR